MNAGGKETEVKLALGRTAPVRLWLRRQGFRLIRPRSFESNLILDTPRRRLRRRGYLLRLRSMNGRHWLALKGPSAASERYKVRTEWETELADAEAGRRVLAGLGFEPVFRYEKFRTVYTGRGRWRGGEVMLDETPVGNYLELEGGRRWIRLVARALGANPDDFITKSYAGLYADWCRRRGRLATHMVFGRGLSP